MVSVKKQSAASTALAKQMNDELVVAINQIQGWGHEIWEELRLSKLIEDAAEALDTLIGDAKDE